MRRVFRKSQGNTGSDSLLKAQRLMIAMLPGGVPAGILGAKNIQIARAASSARLPPAVLQQAPALNQIGKGSQSYFGLRVYHVTLWAASDRWNPEEPHALDLESNRAISKYQLTNAGMSEIDRLGLGDS